MLILRRSIQLYAPMIHGDTSCQHILKKRRKEKKEDIIYYKKNYLKSETYFILPQKKKCLPS